MLSVLVLDAIVTYKQLAHSACMCPCSPTAVLTDHLSMAMVSCQEPQALAGAMLQLHLRMHSSETSLLLIHFTMDGDQTFTCRGIHM